MADATTSKSMIDPKYVANIVKQIDSIPDCNSLMKLLADTEQNMLKALESALASCQLLKMLAEIPTDLESAIKWIQTIVEKQILGPLESSIATYAQTAAALVTILAAITKKAEELGCVEQIASLTNIQVPSITSGMDLSKIQLPNIQNL